MPRSPAERQRHARGQLETGQDLWIATSAAEGTAHLVPFAFAWDGRAVTVVSGASSPTMLNLASRRKARLALGQTRDVVMIDAELESLVEVGLAPRRIIQAYARQAGWTPEPTRGQVIATLVPISVQVWREADEIVGRTVMSKGAWRS